MFRLKHELSVCPGCSHRRRVRLGKASRQVTVALIGHPNTGKTSLLNALGRLHLHVGNWPGKTVEKKSCFLLLGDVCVKVVDLPGTYSIAPYSEEERISRDFITKKKPDVIVQTVDVNTLERNLLMTLELLALHKNLILAFNFNKEAERRGVRVKIDKIRKVLQVPIVKIEANTGGNKGELLKEIIKVSGRKLKTPDYLSSLLKKNQEISHDRAIGFIKKALGPFYSTGKQVCQTEKLDAVFLNKYTAFPFFLGVMFLMFRVTFAVSAPLIDFVDGWFEFLGEWVASLGLPNFFTSFLTEGLIGGVGSVLTFVPLIFVLFLQIALLEDSGYLARTVVLVDRLFHKFGISGRTFIPMILGFGCNVPAIMAARTIRNKKERRIAIFINSFMSCGARLPVYVLFAQIFFPDNASGIIMGLYSFGVAIAFIVSFILSKLIKPSELTRLIIELPPYRMPVWHNVCKQAWYQMGLFIKKAGTIILGAVVVVWFLASMPTGVEYGSEASWLGLVGKAITLFFRPLGFGHWTFAVALLFGLVAKEVVVGTLGTLYGVGEEGLAGVLPSFITPLGALSYLFFVLLYVPCLATVAVIKKETGSWKFTIVQVLVTVLIAWVVSFGVYNVGLFLGYK